MKWTSIIYPPTCPGCDRVLRPEERERGFCGSCLEQIALAEEPCCKICGKALGDERQERCADCRKEEHLFTQGKSLFIYRGPMKEAMYRFKYSRRLSYRRIFAAEALRRYGADPDCRMGKRNGENAILDGADWLARIRVNWIVPVPMHAARERRRGYNQAAVWGQGLSEAVGIPMLSRLLIRTRDTAPQKTLSREERRKNLEGAFALAREDICLRGNRILLVDDIYTTGSTCDAASKVLLEAGAEAVYLLTICIGRDDL